MCGWYKLRTVAHSLANGIAYLRCRPVDRRFARRRHDEPEAVDAMDNLQ
jgi:hypothetical protein